MHTFRKVGGRWEVGYHDASIWYALGSFGYVEIAAAFVNLLNGGKGEMLPSFIMQQWQK